MNQITVNEEELMLLIRCAMFRDSWLNDCLSPHIFNQLTVQAQEDVQRWEEMKP